MVVALSVVVVDPSLEDTVQIAVATPTAVHLVAGVLSLALVLYVMASPFQSILTGVLGRNRERDPPLVLQSLPRSRLQEPRTECLRPLLKKPTHP